MPATSDLSNPYRDRHGNWTDLTKLTTLVDPSDSTYLINQVFGGRRGTQDAILSNLFKRLADICRTNGIEPFYTDDNSKRAQRLLESVFDGSITSNNNGTSSKLVPGISQPNQLDPSSSGPPHGTAVPPNVRGAKASGRHKSKGVETIGGHEGSKR